MTEFLKGNAVSALLNGEVDILIHVTNTQGAMGSGIAREIKERCGDAYFVYKTTEMELGKVSCSDEGVINMNCQTFYGAKGSKYINYGALAECLSKVRKVLSLQSNHKATIGLPYKMGADRAGGDWDVVLELVEYYLKDHTIKIYEL